LRLSWVLLPLSAFMDVLLWGGRAYGGALNRSNLIWLFD
jgi:hypothetical protein